MEWDRNLLFGILAVQMLRVKPQHLVDAVTAMLIDSFSKDLPERLLENGALSENDLNSINQFVECAISIHGGDVKKALAAFGGAEQVYHTFKGSIVLTETGQVKRPPEIPVDVVQELSHPIPGVQETPGRYTHISEYGRGGMGRVLLVHDHHIGRDIALKELLPLSEPQEGIEQPSPVRLSVPLVARFLQESRITGQLEHPSIVPVYELGYRTDGSLYYTMKLVRGKTLSQAILEAGSLKERLRLLPHFIDLC